MPAYGRRLVPMQLKNGAAMNDRRWDSELQQWVYDDDVYQALDAAHLAIQEYYNGDRAWAERWLLRAHEANKAKAQS